MKRSYPKLYNTGGAVGTTAGAIIGSVIPGVGTGLGATVGGAIGSLFGRKKKKKKPKPPATIGRTFSASYGFREGGSLAIPGVSDSIKIEGRSHEAGGVNLAPMGRPDVEVERNEIVTTGENGEPSYVFSAIRMKDKPRTFAEEYERLAKAGNLEGINKLMRLQEEQMGRKKDVTIKGDVRRAEFAKYGGDLTSYRGGGSMYNPKKSAMKYGGRPTKRYGGNLYHGAKRMQTGGDPGPTGFRFYNYPGTGFRFFNNPAMSSPQYSDLNTIKNPGAITALERMAGNQIQAGSPQYIGLSEEDALAKMADSQLPMSSEQYSDLNTLTPEGEREALARMAGLPRTGRGTLPDIEVTAPGNSMYAAIPGISLSDNTVSPSSVSMDPVDVPEVTASASAAGGIPEASGASKALSVAGKVLPYAVDLLNIGLASKAPKPKKPSRVTPTLMDTRVSTTADEEALTQSARAILADPAATPAQKQAATASLNRAKSGVRSEANRMRRNIQRENVGILNRSQEVNAAASERYQDKVTSYENAKLSNISGSVRSISDRIERQAYQKQLRDLQPLQLTAMLHSMPTEDRRAFVKDMLRALPPGHPYRSQLQGLAGVAA